MPNRDSEKLITDGYTTTSLGDELMVCENMKHIRVRLFRPTPKLG